MNVLIIDGQGGALGKILVKAVAEAMPDCAIRAVGTNSAATQAMLKGGPAKGATGENAVIVACREADVILGPMGIVMADALLGEVTPAMAAAVARSRARRILIPMDQCNTAVAGLAPGKVAGRIESALALLKNFNPERGFSQWH